MFFAIMKKHTKIYLDHFGYTTADRILCEVCGREANAIHHIHCRGMGGSKTKDYIENLMACCQDCHEQYGDKTQYFDFLQTIHNKHLWNT